MEDGNEQELLSRVPMDRRDFVKKVVKTTAFAAPIVASFAMDGLTMDAAAVSAPNGSPGGEIIIQP